MPWSQAEIDALMAAAGMLGTAISHQQSDDALRASEEKFQLAFHHTFVPMVISRADDNRILDVNRAFCKGIGYTREETVGQTALNLNLWVNQEEQVRHQQTLAQQGYEEEFKAGFRRKSGEIGMALISAIAIRLGTDLCLLHTVYDITKIDELLKQLTAKNEELQSFTYTVSHDLRAPLITISGFIGYLEEDARKGNLERVLRDADRIKDAVSKMERLLSELLELSRIGRLMNPPQNVPFGEIVNDALQAVHSRLETKRIEMIVRPELPVVYGDRVRLVEVVQNLVDNAAKFMGEQEKPSIEIGVENAGGVPVFFVRDNGIGIESAYHERIFGLFNKLDARAEGTGIGLALVKRIVEVHGGKIWIESQGHGLGATFFFTLADRQDAKDHS
jgi:PAS domain S-box-containing protein